MSKKYSKYPNSFIAAGSVLSDIEECEVGIAHNTTLFLRHPGFAIRYHDTLIVEFYSDCTVIDSGGFRTKTTKDRINRALRPHYNVYSKNGEWFVSKAGASKDKPFEDGMILK